MKGAAMIYAMSDLHGQYDQYRRMLEKIDFSDEDELYILGDSVDRGPQPAELLLDMSMRTNVFPIMGNHDMTAAMILKKLCVEITEENYDRQLDGDFIKALSMWQIDGGQTTLDGFKKLSPDDRSWLIDYLDEFIPYETLTVGGRKFILVHGGIPYEKRHIPLADQIAYELVLDRPDYTKRYYKDAYLVTGHTPTSLIKGGHDGRIYRAMGHIAIDCGAGFGGVLGCIRLDDMAEFYVE